MTRDEAITRIKAALKRRSGKTWSVTGGRGTSWGWITVISPPARCTWRYRLKPNLPDWPENYEGYESGAPGGNMTPEGRAELGDLLGLAGPTHAQGENIPASTPHWAEYVARAEGRTPSVVGQQYWD